MTDEHEHQHEPDGRCLSLNAVSVQHAGAKRAALSEVSLTLRAGALTVLLGANGSGKSTLLKVLASRLVPDAGIVSWGRDLGDRPQARALSVGYASQAPELDPEMSPREHLALFAALYKVPRATRAERIEAVSAQFGLGPFLDQRVDRCSGGMRQRLHLAISVLHAPSLWLFDEPASALDLEAQSTLWSALVAHVRAGGVALVASHDLERAATVADHVLVLEAGRLVVSESIQALLGAHGSLGRAYESLTGRSPGELRVRRSGPGRRRDG